MPNRIRVLILPMLLLLGCSAFAEENSSDRVMNLQRQGLEFRRLRLFAQAADYFHEALSLAAENPDAATTEQRAAITHNLGESYMRMGKKDLSRENLRRALELWTQSGKLDRGAASSHLQLGLLLRSLGQHTEAEKELRQASQICEAGCPDGPESVSILLAFGELYLAQGRIGDAEAAYLRAKDQGPRRVDALAQSDIFSGLAMVYRRQARYREADHSARKALSLAREAGGDGHPKVAAALANLGLIQAFEGQYTTARKSLREAIGMTEKLAGSNGPEVAASLANLAFVDQQTRNFRSARELFQRAYEIQIGIHGGEHPAVASLLTSLGTVTLQDGDAVAAEDFLRRSLAMTEKLLGSEHPETAAVLDSLGLALIARGRAEEAIAVLDRAVSTRMRVLGDGHPHVAMTLQHQAEALRLVGRKKEGSLLEKRARDIRMSLLRKGLVGQTVDVEILRGETQ